MPPNPSIQIGRAFLASATITGLAAAAEPTAPDIDAAVRKVIAETAVFVEECGKVFPDAKPRLDAAFADWVVLKLPIPGVADVVRADSPERLALSRSIGPYLQRIPGHEKEIECSGRYQVLLSKEPQLGGDSAPLPPNVLDRYRK
jgi:hypothetical protein